MSTNVLETVEIARHAAETGADICFSSLRSLRRAAMRPLVSCFATWYRGRISHLVSLTPRGEVDIDTSRVCPRLAEEFPGNLRCEEWDVQAVCFRCIASTRTGTGHLGVRHAGLSCRLSPPGHHRARHSRRIGVLV